MGSALSFGYDNPLRAVLVGISVTVLALTFAQLATLPAFFLDPAMLEGELAETGRLARVVFLVLNFVGMALGGAVYLWATGRGWEWIDLRRPTKRDAIWTGAGIGLLVLFYIAFNVVVMALELPSAESDVVLLLQDDVVMILIMIGIVFLLNAPVEEFVFRNIVQKRLYAAFPNLLAVLIASLIFAVIHLPVYLVLSPSTMATFVTLTFLFGGALLFGFVYERTGNLLVPIGVHALLNGFMLLLYLAAVVFEVDEQIGEAAAALVDVAAVVA